MVFSATFSVSGKYSAGIIVIVRASGLYIITVVVISFCINLSSAVCLFVCLSRNQTRNVTSVFEIG